MILDTSGPRGSAETGASAPTEPSGTSATSKKRKRRASDEGEGDLDNGNEQEAGEQEEQDGEGTGVPGIVGLLSQDSPNFIKDLESRIRAAHVQPRGLELLAWTAASSLRSGKAAGSKRTSPQQYASIVKRYEAWTVRAGFPARPIIGPKAALFAIFESKRPKLKPGKKAAKAREAGGAIDEGGDLVGDLDGLDEESGWLDGTNLGKSAIQGAINALEYFRKEELIHYPKERVPETHVKLRDDASVQKVEEAAKRRQHLLQDSVNIVKSAGPAAATYTAATFNQLQRLFFMQAAEKSADGKPLYVGAKFYQAMVNGLRNRAVLLDSANLIQRSDNARNLLFSDTQVLEVHIEGLPEGFKAKVGRRCKRRVLFSVGCTDVV